jgi:hypothetical protein
MKSILCDLAVEEAHNSLMKNHPDQAILSLCEALRHLNGVEEKDKPEKDSVQCWLEMAHKAADANHLDLAFHALASAVQKLSFRVDSKSPPQCASRP